ncbi:hypothetical protein PHMEG_00022455 [Phytophthora megakarya]|uniref:Uncharacterized protein n=1 Tax=Phytophthora megakarya TaxID=4795 RepID=A0A225VIP4_9STRA|nr:hypothetical protein PHMEG_00022455 [Phytophthora megakarya]
MEAAATMQHVHPNTVFHYGKAHLELGQGLYQYHQQKPLPHLDEAQAAFTQAHRVVISITLVCPIIHDFGLT